MSTIGRQNSIGNIHWDSKSAILQTGIDPNIANLWILQIFEFKAQLKTFESLNLRLRASNKNYELVRVVEFAES